MNVISMTGNKKEKVYKTFYQRSLAGIHQNRALSLFPELYIIRFSFFFFRFTQPIIHYVHLSLQRLFSQ